MPVLIYAQDFEKARKMSKIKYVNIKIYTDGSCLGNPGPGGWAYLIEFEGGHFDGTGGQPYTTNNRMELQAVIEALKTLKKKNLDGKIFIYSDSSWVVKTMKENWKRKKNLDLWSELMPLLINKDIEWQWVKGHSGHPQNEFCDKKALQSAKHYAILAKDMDPKDLCLPDEAPTLF